MTVFFKRTLNFLTLSIILGGILFVSNSFAKSELNPCDLIQKTYNICSQGFRKELESKSYYQKKKICSFNSVRMSIDMYSALSKKFDDKELAKNVSILLGLICKDGCLGTDDFYSESKEKVCK